MGLKELLEKTGGWLTNRKARADYHPPVDEHGLISNDSAEEGQADQEKNNQLAIEKVEAKAKPETLEKLQAGFDKLIEQLEGINTNLGKQMRQNEEMMARIESLPKLLESFPAVVQNQQQLTEQLFEQLRSAAVKNEQFVDSIGKIPKETAKQSDWLENINHQLAASAEADVQMVEGFNKFNETLDKLNMTSASQTDSIMTMSRTFSTSDRYLKYLMSVQNRRFMWIFFIALGVCVGAILILVGLIFYSMR